MLQVYSGNNFAIAITDNVKVVGGGRPTVALDEILAGMEQVGDVGHDNVLTKRIAGLVYLDTTRWLNDVLYFSASATKRHRTD